MFNWLIKFFPPTRFFKLLKKNHEIFVKFRVFLEWFWHFNLSGNIHEEPNFIDPGRYFVKYNQLPLFYEQITKILSSKQYFPGHTLSPKLAIEKPKFSLVSKNRCNIVVHEISTIFQGNRVFSESIEHHKVITEMSSMHNTARIFRYEDFDVALKTYFFTTFRATELLTELEWFSGDLWDGN